jgi:hypothetical protein
MNMMEMAAMESPALCGVSAHWPKKWDRVPKRVRMLRTALPDHILAMVNPKLRGLAAVKGQDYPVWVNRHGAVSAALPGGQRLGLYPSEFEVVEFHDAQLIRQAGTQPSSQAVGKTSQYSPATEEPEDEA